MNYTIVDIVLNAEEGVVPGKFKSPSAVRKDRLAISCRNFSASYCSCAVALIILTAEDTPSKYNKYFTYIHTHLDCCERRPSDLLPLLFWDPLLSEQVVCGRERWQGQNALQNAYLWLYHKGITRVRSAVAIIAQTDLPIVRARSRLLF